jgi:hypothetical protein
VTGSSDFTREFGARGPRDAQGRSLRQFDLTTHLFRYPLSYMLYSQSFANLNPAARALVWRQVYDRLREHGAAGRDAIAIVAATKPDAPDFWKAMTEK